MHKSKALPKALTLVNETTHGSNNQVKTETPTRWKEKFSSTTYYCFQSWFFANEDQVIQTGPVFTVNSSKNKTYCGPCVSDTAGASSSNIQIFECSSKIPLKLRVSPVLTHLEVFAKKAFQQFKSLAVLNYTLKHLLLSCDLGNTALLESTWVFFFFVFFFNNICQQTIVADHQQWCEERIILKSAKSKNTQLWFYCWSD